MCSCSMPDKNFTTVVEITSHFPHRIHQLPVLQHGSSSTWAVVEGTRRASGHSGCEDC